MKNAEQAVQRVLEGLRDVDAPTGMDERILLAMRRRVAEPAPSRLRRMWRGAPTRAVAVGGVAFAGLLCLVLWPSTLHRSAGTPAVAHLSALRPASTKVTEIAPVPMLAVRAPRMRLKELASAMSEEDALVLDEVRAPSHPAPPMPLTVQERLLLRVASQPAPEQVAVLNPEMRIQQELQAKVEFQNFFEPVVPVEEKSITKTINEKGETR